MRRSRISPRLALAPGLAVLLAGLVACESETRLAEGECRDAYGSDVCTWAQFQGDELLEFGATIPLASIEGAPSEGEFVWPPPHVAKIRLPEEVKATAGFDHLMINWEVHGHPPALFLTPHFDFHFFTISLAEAEAIDCSDLTKPAELATGYALPDMEIPGVGELIGLCVPTMGMHSMLEAEMEQADPFDASMIVGYYRGELVFIEPMISRMALLQEEGFSVDIPAIANVPAQVSLPASFQADYDEANSQYRFVFGFASE